MKDRIDKGGLAQSATPKALDSHVVTYDLASEYTRRVAAGLAMATDWEVLGLVTPTPRGYHFTKQGLPDKRYANYPEVAAYYDAELELRSDYIRRAQERVTDLVDNDPDTKTDVTNPPKGAS